jgi:LAO/AO transport system kinase
VHPVQWTPPVLRAVASAGEGVTELLDAIDRHFAFLEESGSLRERRRRRLRVRVIEAVEQRVRERLWRDTRTNEWLDARISSLEAGETTPFIVADELLRRSAALLAGEGSPRNGPSDE